MFELPYTFFEILIMKAHVLLQMNVSADISPPLQVNKVQSIRFNVVNLFGSLTTDLTHSTLMGGFDAWSFLGSGASPGGFGLCNHCLGSLLVCVLCCWASPENTDRLQFINRSVY